MRQAVPLPIQGVDHTRRPEGAKSAISFYQLPSTTSMADAVVLFPCTSSLCLYFLSYPSPGQELGKETADAFLMRNGSPLYRLSDRFYISIDTHAPREFMWHTEQLGIKRINRVRRPH